MDFTTMGSGPGIVEEGIHPSSGLRCAVQSGVFNDASACVATALMANASDWTAITLESLWGTTTTQSFTRLPFPCTPCITYRQTNATPNNGQTFSVRVTGRDQFGQTVQETVSNQVTAYTNVGTPVSPYSRRTRLWLSKVFSAITKVEYKASSVQGTSDYLDVGVYWDFDYSGNFPPYENYIGQANQGIGTILQVNAFGPSQGLTLPEIECIELVSLDPQVYPITAATAANPCVISSNGLSLGTPPSAITAANPAVLTTGTHNIPANAKVWMRLGGFTGANAKLNGDWIVTYASGTTVSIPVNATSTVMNGAEFASLVPIVGPMSGAGSSHFNNRLVPVLVSGVATNGDPVNGYHLATITSPNSITLPVDSAGDTITFAGGSVQVLSQPSCVMQPYATDKGGFRMGTSASGFPGTPHKWNVYMKKAGLGDGTETSPLLESNMMFAPTANAPFVQFPWFRGSNIAFKAYYRSAKGTIRGASGSSSYAT